MARVIHYLSTGSSLSFKCYDADLRSWLDKKAPEPRKTTNLAQITCPECWLAIYEMAKPVIKAMGRKRGEQCTLHSPRQRGQNDS